LGDVRPNQKAEIALSDSDREFLLFDWLRELLLLADEQHLLFSRFDVTVTDNGLTGTAWGEPLDPARHLLLREVKAITYHELKVEPTPDGWLAEVIVDI
jgi:SHS2 domain-containing protein